MVNMRRTPATTPNNLVRDKSNFVNRIKPLAPFKSVPQK